MKNDVDNNKFIGSRIKEARERAKKSQKELASVLGYDTATAISLIESGGRKLKVEDLSKIAKFLNCDTRDFLGQEYEKPRIKTVLRSEKGLDNKDIDNIMNFIEWVKNKKK